MDNGQALGVVKHGKWSSLDSGQACSVVVNRQWLCMESSSMNGLSMDSGQVRSVVKHGQGSSRRVVKQVSGQARTSMC